MNAEVGKKRRPKADERALQLRSVYWPDLQEDSLWHRLKYDGYVSVPRTLPILMNIIDSLSKRRPAGRTYAGLWYRTRDESMVIIENPMSLAYEAGFSGERAVTTWRQRMQTLQSLGLIDSKPGSSGDFHYVLIFNPHKVIWQLKPRIQSRVFMQLHDRAIEIGADDMRPPEAIVEDVPLKKRVKKSKAA